MAKMSIPIQVDWESIKDYLTKSDIVEVIRCKDCKFATITDGVYGRDPEVKYCDIWFPTEAEYMPINYYCASAERKERMTLDEAAEKINDAIYDSFGWLMEAEERKE